MARPTAAALDSFASGAPHLVQKRASGFMAQWHSVAGHETEPIYFPLGVVIGADTRRGLGILEIGQPGLAAADCPVPKVARAAGSCRGSSLQWYSKFYKRPLRTPIRHTPGPPLADTD